VNDEVELNDGDEIVQKPRNPLYGLVALFTAVALFLLSMQGYFSLIHPEPQEIVSLEEVQTFIPENLEGVFSSHRADEVKKVLQEVQDPIKQIANYIAAKACKNGDRVCQSKALHYFVRDNITYVPDAKFHDQLENPLAVLKTGGADCEDMAVLDIALQKAIGNDAQLVFIPGHAYAQVGIKDYKGGDWLNLEATCKTCDFNQIPEKNVLAKKRFYEL